MSHHHHHHLHPDAAFHEGHHHHHGDHLSHSLDLVTTLRSELAASTYKRDRLINELSEAKATLCAKDSENEAIRAQNARQSTLITSLQQRLQATEVREKNILSRSENTSQTLLREKRGLEEKSKDLFTKVRRLECDLLAEETHREQAKTHLSDLVRRLCLCLGIDVCETSHLTPETILGKAGEVVSELQRLRTKLAATCESLAACEAELLNVRSCSSADRQRIQSQVESLQSLSQGLETRARQAEKELAIARDRLAECELNGGKLREEVRGFENRSARLQNNTERIHADRLQFLRHIGTIIGVAEPCETLIKDKIRELTNENQTLHSQAHSLREQLSLEAARHRELHDSTSSRIRSDEVHKNALEDRVEKAHAELAHMKSEHTNLSEYLVRLARVLSWSECTEPPTHGSDTTVLAESLLERAERLALHHDHHIHEPEFPHHHHNSKLRRERSYHDLTMKDCSSVYSLQRRVRVLREQVQRRDLHLELLRRKIALLDDGARGKAILQTERDEALNRARRTSKHAEKSSHQLLEVKNQLADVKSQLAEAAEYKLTALERGRKIDELNRRILGLETERNRLSAQLSNFKTRARSAEDSTHEVRVRDEHVITNLRDELSRIKVKLADANHRMAQLQSFRSSIARLLHLRDTPQTDILHRIQSLCNAHHDFTLLSRRYESASPVADHSCPRFDDPIPPVIDCRPISSSPTHIKCPARFTDSGFMDHHLYTYDDDYEFGKKY